MTRSHKIGWLVLAMALLFVLWRLPRLHGQGFGSFSHDQPYLAKDRSVTGEDSSAISNMWAWWTSKDLTNGTVYQWTNRVAADGTPIITNRGSTAVNFVDKDATGVYFDNNNNYIFEHTPRYLGSDTAGRSIWIVAKPNTANNREVLGSPSAQFVMDSQRLKLIGGTWLGDTRHIGTITNGILNDWLLTWATDGVNSYYTSYQAGVLFTNWSAVIGAGEGIQVKQVGSWQDAGPPLFIGWICELRYYSNKLSASNAFALYQYRTNTYGL